MSISAADLAAALRFDGEVVFTTRGMTLRGNVHAVTPDRVQLETGFRDRSDLVSVKIPGLFGRPFGQYLCEHPSPIEGFGVVHETNSLSDMIELMDAAQRVLILVRVDGEIEFVTGRVTKVALYKIELNGCIEMPRDRIAGYAKAFPESEPETDDEVRFDRDF